MNWGNMLKKAGIWMTMLVIVPAVLIWGILLSNENVINWVGFIFIVFALTGAAVLPSFKQAYAFAIKKPNGVKAAVFCGVYYLLWSGFFFFWLMVIIGQWQ